MSNREKIDIVMKKYRYKKNCIINVLQDIQNENNCLRENILRYVSQKMNISLVDIYGISTFYKNFILEEEKV